MFAKRPSRGNASRMALGNAVHGPGPRIHSSNVDGTARKEKNEENLFCQFGTSIRLRVGKPRMYTRSLSIGASRR
jgi:hypothetical protein